MSAEEAAHAGAGAGEEAEASDGYVVAEKRDLATIMAQDAEDESLRKYKASLLGTSAASAVATDPSGRRVVIHELRIMVEGRPDIVIPTSTPAEIEALASRRITVQEGATYTLRIVFSVFADVVLGLCACTTVTNGLGLRVDKSKAMLGSYPPAGTRNTFDCPPAEYPSGWMARGAYKVRTVFTDDDKNTHLDFTWHFDIKKNWAGDE